MNSKRRLLPSQYKTLGVLLRVGGMVLVPLGVYVGILGVSFKGRIGPWHADNILEFMFAEACFFAASYGLVTAGHRISLRGRQQLTEIITLTLAIGAMPSPLYLRSFDIDPTMSVPEHARSDATVAVAAGAAPWLRKPSLTEEEQLAAGLSPFGKMIAIGRPGEKLPMVGARRLYLPPNDWHDSVHNLMTRANLVILAVGCSKGLMWELGEAVRSMRPETLTLIVAVDPESYEQFRTEAARELQEWSPVVLPPYPQSWTYQPGKMTGAICFSPDWTPRFLNFERTSGTESNDAQHAIEQTLVPALLDSGIRGEPQSPENSRTNQRIQGRRTLRKHVAELAVSHRYGQYIDMTTIESGRLTTTIMLTAGALVATMVSMAIGLSGHPGIALSIISASILLWIAANVRMHRASPTIHLHQFMDGLVLVKKKQLTPHAWADLDVVKVRAARGADHDAPWARLYEHGKLLIELNDPKRQFAATAHRRGAGKSVRSPLPTTSTNSKNALVAAPPQTQADQEDPAISPARRTPDHERVTRPSKGREPKLHPAQGIAVVAVGVALGISAGHLLAGWGRIVLVVILVVGTLVLFPIGRGRR